MKTGKRLVNCNSWAPVMNYVLVGAVHMRPARHITHDEVRGSENRGDSAGIQRITTRGSGNNLLSWKNGRNIRRDLPDRSGRNRDNKDGSAIWGSNKIIVKCRSQKMWERVRRGVKCGTKIATLCVQRENVMAWVHLTKQVFFRGIWCLHKFLLCGLLYCSGTRSKVRLLIRGCKSSLPATKWPSQWSSFELDKPMTSRLFYSPLPID